jgi:hypothetical protein
MNTKRKQFFESYYANASAACMTSMFKFLREKFFTLNVFDSRSLDPTIVHREILSTRLFIISIIIWPRILRLVYKSRMKSSTCRLSLSTKICGSVTRTLCNIDVPKLFRRFIESVRVILLSPGGIKVFFLLIVPMSHYSLYHLLCLIFEHWPRSVR